MDEAGFASLPTAVYVVVLLLAAVSYSVLVSVLVRVEGRDSPFARALGNNFKGKVSLAAYLVAIPGAFIAPPLALAVCGGVALLWLIPDRRFEPSASRRKSA